MRPLAAVLMLSVLCACSQATPGPDAAADADVRGFEILLPGDAAADAAVTDAAGGVADGLDAEAAQPGDGSGDAGLDDVAPPDASPDAAVKDTQQPDDDALPDESPEQTGDTPAQELPQPDSVLPPPIDPSAWGPYEVGTFGYNFFDWERLRSVPTTVWYPAKPSGQTKATYLALIPGNAYTNAPPDTSAAPYPAVLFSHGFKGVAAQSITFTEHIASHGYVVIAMDHSGNTLTDFFATDESTAQVALDRPVDVRFAFEQVMAKSMAPDGGYMKGMVDPDRVAVTGHSFGGYTALMVAGGAVNVSDAQAACAAGTPADIFCDYVGYWPAGEVVTLSPSISGLKAAFTLAPGGSAAFGPTGLESVTVPAVVMGGTLDDTTPVDVETNPIFDGLPLPKGRGIITNASHMSFTNVCDLPLAKQFLSDYCGVEGMIGPEEAFAIANGLAVSFLNFYVKGVSEYGPMLTQDYVAGKYPQLDWTWIETEP